MGCVDVGCAICAGLGAGGGIWLGSGCVDRGAAVEAAGGGVAGPVIVTFADAGGGGSAVEVPGVTPAREGCLPDAAAVAAAFRCSKTCFRVNFSGHAAALGVTAGLAGGALAIGAPSAG